MILGYNFKIKISLLILDLIIESTNQQQLSSNDVYNIPWDFKNKLIQQQQQQSTQLIALKPPSIQPPPPPPPTSFPITTNMPQFKSLVAVPTQTQEYCAPWDLKLQEERFKHLTITTNTPSGTITKPANASNNNINQHQSSPIPPIQNELNIVHHGIRNNKTFY